MTQISEEIVREILKNYRPSCRPLKSASLDYPAVRGEFMLSPTFYHIPSFNHATDIEIQLCLNQLAYVGMSEAIREQIVPELRGLSFEEVRKEGMLIIESKKRFRKPIDTGKRFCGQITLDEWRDFGKVMMAYANFDFEKKSCIGRLEVVLVKPNGTLT